LLLIVEGGDLLVQAVELLLRRLLAHQDRARQVLTVGGQRLAGLVVHTVDVRLELGRLQLQALLRGRDLDDAALEVLDLLQLALVRVVERLAGVLRFVEDAAHLRLEDGRHTAQDAH